ncbi:hypothetical protein A6A29_21440 [Streptomyces sp. TSRI0281]|nr:hypothetical protein A6A29_21440 [Streptomyces sp. TSRI0281]
MLSLVYKKSLVMLMGDATVLTEKFILGAWAPKIPSDSVTLKMGHHGSATSSHEQWVKLLKPKRLTVSSGTKFFQESGIPTLAHLNNVQGWSGKIEESTAHEYTYFNDRYFNNDQISMSVFTSQLMVNPDWTETMAYEQRFICGNWHLTIDDQGRVEVGY